MELAGWEYRRRKAYWEKQLAVENKKPESSEQATSEVESPLDPFAKAGQIEQVGKTFDPAVEQHTGIVLGAHDSDDECHEQ